MGEEEEERTVWKSGAERGERRDRAPHVFDDEEVADTRGLGTRGGAPPGVAARHADDVGWGCHGAAGSRPAGDCGSSTGGGGAKGGRAICGAAASIARSGVRGPRSYVEAREPA